MVVQANSNETIIAQNKKMPVCPRCKSQFDSRVPRSFFVKNILFFIPLKRYMCYNCQRKHYLLG
jgi:transposase-like protein